VTVGKLLIINTTLLIAVGMSGGLMFLHLAVTPTVLGAIVAYLMVKRMKITFVFFFLFNLAGNALLSLAFYYTIKHLGNPELSPESYINMLGFAMIISNIFLSKNQLDGKYDSDDGSKSTTTSPDPTKQEDK